MANRYEDPNAQMKDENVSSQWHPGKVLGVFKTEAKDSPAILTLGESVAFIEAGQREQAIVQEEVPPGYEDIIRGYFENGQ